MRDAPRAAAPARASATVSACGRPPGAVRPRPTTRPSRTITQPTEGLGQTTPSAPPRQRQRCAHVGDVVGEFGHPPAYVASSSAPTKASKSLASRKLR